MLLHDISAPTSEDQGEVVVYRWVEWVREFITQRARQLQEGRPDTVALLPHLPALGVSFIMIS